MKKIFLSGWIVLMGLTAACSAKTPESVASVEQGNAVSGQVQYLTTADFLLKVHDYHANPDVWKFKGDKPCLIDFYADWCRPCKMLAPVMEELAAEYAGQINVYKVNVDQEKELSAAFGIQSIPSLLFVPQDGQPAMQAGVLPKEQLDYYIRTFLLGQSGPRE